MKKSLKTNGIAWLAALLLLLAAIPLNMLASMLDIKWDMTPNSVYSLSKDMQEVLDSISEPIDMYFFHELEKFRLEVKPGDDGYAQSAMIISTLDALNEHPKINFHSYDVDKNPDIVSEVDPSGELGIGDYSMVLKKGDIVRNIPINEMILYGETNGTAYYQGESLISGAIKFIESGQTPTVYFLKGHDEAPFSDYALMQSKLKASNYTSKELDLSKEDKVPEDAVLIIMAAPKKDISDDEAEKLNAYADNGGCMSFWMSPNEATLEYDNIEEIMASYGLAMDYNKVYETSDSYYIDDKYKVAAELIDVESGFNKELIEIYKDYYVIMPASRSFYAANSEKEGLTVEPLIQTYDSAESEACGGTKLSPSLPKGYLYLAAKSEDASRNNSKLVVMGNAEFINDENLATTYTILTVQMYMTTVSWMDPSMTADFTIFNKIQSYDFMEIYNRGTGNRILALIIAIPIVIVAIGVAVWLRRRNA